MNLTFKGRKSSSSEIQPGHKHVDRLVQHGERVFLFRRLVASPEREHTNVQCPIDRRRHRPPVGVDSVSLQYFGHRLELLRQNRLRFGAYNIRIVAGGAPEELRGERQAPHRIFLGGSGGKLPEILELAAERMAPGGRLVAAFVTLEHLALTLEKLRQWRWRWEVSEINVSRSDPLAGLTGLKPQRGVFLVSADKPGSNRE